MRRPRPLDPKAKLASITWAFYPIIYRAPASSRAWLLRRMSGALIQWLLRRSAGALNPYPRCAGGFIHSAASRRPGNLAHS